MASQRGSLRWPLLCIIAGTVALLVGCVLFAIPAPTASFGWFAYTPLSDTVFSPTATLLPPPRLAGLIVGVIGGLLLAFGAGWRHGLRRKNEH